MKFYMGLLATLLSNYKFRLRVRPTTQGRKYPERSVRQDTRDLRFRNYQQPFPDYATIGKVSSRATRSVV